MKHAPRRAIRFEISLYRLDLARVVQAFNNRFYEFLNVLCPPFTSSQFKHIAFLLRNVQAIVREVMTVCMFHFF